MNGRSPTAALPLVFLAVLGGCHPYYFASATIPLSVPVDTTCLARELTGGSGFSRLNTEGAVDGGRTTAVYGTPAMFRSAWATIAQESNAGHVEGGEAVTDSSARLSAGTVRISRRFGPREGPAMTDEMTIHLFDLRDRCGGRSPGGERLFAVDVDDTPYRAWSVRGSSSRIVMRLTVDSLRYFLHFRLNAGRQVLRVDTLADEANPRFPRWIEVDTLVLPRAEKGTTIATECWRGDSISTGALVARVPRTDTRYWTDARDAWELEVTTFRIRAAAVNGIECVNRGWGTLLPSAPHQHRAAALTFRPSPGKARIYAYLSSPDFPVSYAIAQVAIDSQVVGRVHGGAFLMVEVEPGPHRVSSLSGKNESAAVIDAAPDSSYFFELRRVLFTWSWRANIRPMEPETARSAIRRAHMVPSAWPGTPVEARE